MAHSSDNPVVGILHCPCGKQMKVRRNALGRPGRCKRCRRILRADAESLSPVPGGMAEPAAISTPGLDARSSGGGSHPDWQDDAFAPAQPAARASDSGAGAAVSDPGLNAEPSGKSWDDEDEGLFDVPLEDTDPGRTEPEFTGPDTKDDWIGEETPAVPLPVLDDDNAGEGGTTWDAVAPEADDDLAADGTTWDAVAPEADDDWDSPPSKAAAPAPTRDTDTEDDDDWDDAVAKDSGEDSWDMPSPPAEVSDSWADASVEQLKEDDDDASAAATAPPAPKAAASAWDSLDDELSNVPADDRAVDSTMGGMPDARDDHMDEWYDAGDESDPDYSAGQRQQAWERRRKTTRTHRKHGATGKTTRPALEPVGGRGKRRTPALIYPLSVITFGIYYLYWVYVVFQELYAFMPREKRMHPLIALLLHFAPVVNVVWPVFVPIRAVIEARDIQLLRGREPSGSPLAVGAALGFSIVTFLISIGLLSMGADMALYSLIGLAASSGMWWIGLAQAQAAVNTIYGD